MSERKNILRVEHATMQFGGVVAVDDLSLEVNEGEIVALIGPNGAGKTTAFNVITGVYQPTNGRVAFLDETIIRNHPQGKMKKSYKGKHGDMYTAEYAPEEALSGEALNAWREGEKARDAHAFTAHVLAPTPDEITKLGMARTFQNIRLWKSQTVFDNVLIAKHLRKESGFFSAAFHTNAKEEADAPDAKPFAPGDIEFDHVSFGYEGQEVLHDLSFTIRQGETFAILGGTGSGKSTLVQLLDRLYDVQSGSIRIGGVDLRELSRSDLRRNIGFVLQEPFLFSQTIRENICAARPDATEEEMRAAARIACVDEAISAFPEGYDTVVGERGVTLSGGQKQRVAIARMLLQRAPVMIFDDSLSAVDTETDAQIRAALRHEQKDVTTLIISHRVTTLSQADLILVLENGQITQQGTHAELCSQSGLYQRINSIQNALEEELTQAKAAEGVN